MSVWTQLASSEKLNSGRYVTSDTKEGRLFNVTITKLAADDAGIYWCGVGTGKATGSRNLMTKVKVTVTGEWRISVSEGSYCSGCSRVRHFLLSSLSFNR